MVRRFPVVYNERLGFEGKPMVFLIGTISLLVVGSVVARAMTSDNKIEHTKRHHPKGIGYTSINHQMDNMRDKAQTITPKLDEHYWEYSTKRRRHINQKS